MESARITTIRDSRGRYWDVPIHFERTCYLTGVSLVRYGIVHPLGWGDAIPPSGMIEHSRFVTFASGLESAAEGWYETDIFFGWATRQQNVSYAYGRGPDSDVMWCFSQEELLAIGPVDVRQVSGDVMELPLLHVR